MIGIRPPWTRLRHLAVLAHYECLAHDIDYRFSTSFYEMKRIMDDWNDYLTELELDLDRTMVDAQRLVTEGFRNIGSLMLPQKFSPNGLCVYLLRDKNDEVVYVGQSKNVLSRLGAHASDKNKRPHMETVEMIWCRSKEDMDRIERELIVAHTPRFNTVHKPKQYRVSNVPDFGALDRT